MRAVLCEGFGEPAAVLRLRDVAEPAPAPGEVLVRAAARSVNPSDLLTVRGVYARHTRLPLVPGFEAVGTVVAVGPGVPAGMVGHRVLPLKGAGTWQELVTAPAEWLVDVPAEVPDAVATQLYINPISVLRMLTVELSLRPGDVVVVNAAGSACGRIAAQLARELDLRLLAVTRSDAYTDELLMLGATAVVNAGREDVAAAVHGLTDGRGARAALDAIGGAAGEALVDLLEPGGTLVSYGLLSGALLPVDLPAAKARGVAVRSFWLRPWTETCTQAEWRAAFRAIIDRVVSGTLVLPVGGAYDLAEMADAARAAEASGRIGKIVLTG
ncbi:MAG TPA: zinc-dependent alcohol dehydrogenase family protein [Azospirillum sp.]|nr:zinc-dependent alcohol dehydrogenase family protein [Azospirillum sp.]